MFDDGSGCRRRPDRAGSRVCVCEREREELTRPPFFLQYAKLKKFVKDQKKRTKKVSKKHEWTQRKSRLQQDA